MNKKLQPTILALSLAASFGANAVVYKIENIDALYNVKGTLKNSNSGFGATLNNSGDIIGNSLFTQVARDATNSAINANISGVNRKERDGRLIPVARRSGFQFDSNNMPQIIKVLEESITGKGRAPFSIHSNVNAISDSGIIVGSTSSAVKEVADPDQSDSNASRGLPYYVYDFLERGFVIDGGTTHTFAPTFDTWGGRGGFTAINDNNLIVGYASTAIENNVQKTYDSRCTGTGSDAKLPKQLCGTKVAEFMLQAYSWQYANGQLTNPTPLGVLAAPISDSDLQSYNSYALDVNNAGIAVGQSIAFRNGDKKINNRFNVAVVFKDGKVIDLMKHDDTSWRYSAASAINNNNLAVGYVNKTISGFARNKFFIYNVDSSDVTLTFPNDFSSTESDRASSPKDINDNNQVVGSIEVDTVKSENRRTHGFLYNHDKAEFNDINNLLTCESKGYVKDGSTWKKYVQTLNAADNVSISYNTEINIVDAQEIANDGTIIATALVTVPRYRYRWVNEAGETVASQNSKGVTLNPQGGTTFDLKGAISEVLMDANGRPSLLLDSSGKPLTERLPRAVVLKTVAGEACKVVGDGSVNAKQTRKGAGFGIGALAMVTLGLFIRRFRAKK